MAIYNTRGGEAKNYSLGRGKLYIQGDVTGIAPNAPSAAMAEVGGWRDVGNVTNFTLSQESETKEHRSNLSGIQTIDLELAVSQKMSIAFTTDELSVHNLARFLSGELINYRQGIAVYNAAAIASDNSTYVGLGMPEHFYIDTNTTDNVHNVWIDLYLEFPALLNPQGKVSAIDFESQALQPILVRKAATNRDGTGGTTLTEGTHYEVDRKFGRIRFTAAAGGLAAGDTIQVEWAAPTVNKAPIGGVPGSDDSLSTISLLTTSGKTVALKFISENPNNADVQARLELWKVKLRPEGELAEIGDDWSQLSFTGSLESIASPPQGGSPYGRLTIRESFST